MKRAQRFGLGGVMVACMLLAGQSVAPPVQEVQPVLKDDAAKAAWHEKRARYFQLLSTKVSVESRKKELVQEWNDLNKLVDSTARQLDEVFGEIEKLANDDKVTLEPITLRLLRKPDPRKTEAPLPIPTILPVQ